MTPANCYTLMGLSKALSISRGKLKYWAKSPEFPQPVGAFFSSKYNKKPFEHYDLKAVMDFLTTCKQYKPRTASLTPRAKHVPDPPETVSGWAVPKYSSREISHCITTRKALGAIFLARSL